MHDDAQWVDIAEAARRLGCSVVTVRRRIKQGTLEGELQQGRRGTEYRVRLPAESTLINREPILEPIRDDAQEPVTPTHLIAELIRLQEQHRAEMAEVRAKLDAARDVILRSAQDEVEWRTRAESLEERLNEMRAELERARRPWWRRWLS
jgi:hypothetical protein